MAWKIRQRAFDFGNPALHLLDAQFKLHLVWAGRTVQLYIGADEPMQARLFLVLDGRVSVMRAKGYTARDLTIFDSALSTLGVGRSLRNRALGPLRPGALEGLSLSAANEDVRVTG